MTNWAEERKAREEGVAYVFECSKREVKLRPLDFQMFVTYGDIPDILTGTVNELLEQGQGKAEDITPSVAFMRNMGRLQAAFATAVLVWPRIVDQPEGADQISIEDLRSDELQELWKLATDPLLQLQLFRPEEAPDGDAKRHRKTNRSATL